jgi:hypothetical protein
MRAQEKAASRAMAAAAGFTKVRYRSEVLSRREREIQDFRLQISDFRFTEGGATAPENPIENRQSKFDNPAAQAQEGPVAQLVRACA